MKYFGNYFRVTHCRSQEKRGAVFNLYKKDRLGILKRSF